VATRDELTALHLVGGTIASHAPTAPATLGLV
jgi:hypothetical protein